jgi:hypothetical protein
VLRILILDFSQREYIICNKAMMYVGVASDKGREDPTFCEKTHPDFPVSSPFITAIGGTQLTSQGLFSCSLSSQLLFRLQVALIFVPITYFKKKYTNLLFGTYRHSRSGPVVARCKCQQPGPRASMLLGPRYPFTNCKIVFCELISFRWCYHHWWWILGAIFKVSFVLILVFLLFSVISRAITDLHTNNLLFAAI